jgi:hypothetical protein
VKGRAQLATARLRERICALGLLCIAAGACAAKPQARPKPQEVDQPGVTTEVEGIRFTVSAEPRQVEGGFGVDIDVVARGMSEQRYVFWGRPAPNLAGRTIYADGKETEFGDGCWSGKRLELGRGKELSWSRRHGDGMLEAVAPGTRLHLSVGFCRVRPVDAATFDPSLHLDVAEIVLSVSDAGVATVTVRPSGS